MIGLLPIAAWIPVYGERVEVRNPDGAPYGGIFLGSWGPEPGGQLVWVELDLRPGDPILVDVRQLARWR